MLKKYWISLEVTILYRANGKLTGPRKTRGSRGSQSSYPFSITLKNSYPGIVLTRDNALGNPQGTLTLPHTLSEVNCPPTPVINT